MPKPVILFLLLLGSLTASPLQAQEVTIVTVVESSSSMTRSRVLVTGPEGRTEQIDMKNIWGLGGVNLKNLAENDRTMQTLFEGLLKGGWRLDNVMPVPGEEGQLLTRYIYSRYPDEVPAAVAPPPAAGGDGGR